MDKAKYATIVYQKLVKFDKATAKWIMGKKNANRAVRDLILQQITFESDTHVTNRMGYPTELDVMGNDLNRCVACDAVCSKKYVGLERVRLCLKCFKNLVLFSIEKNLDKVLV